ncbi:unnamed protein product [Cyprideis torosa]|uniref:Uncharacterized protein n=1 Tax=Cyprideis torosa TaxID=163714 RepID=A0A7R8W1C1_9CRUS|nr:unnamed protein product [Cyprideis torosa]CAG0880578.1 unnamed protein product [Cyprideis torosa]
MTDLLAVPLKKASEVSLIQPLRTIIASTFSTADKREGDQFREAIEELNTLRSNAAWKTLDKHESSLETLCRYHDQVASLEAKIPPGEVNIQFKWKDAFDRGSLFGARLNLTIPSFSYERVCVLFNIAALQTQIAAAQNRQHDEGLKVATKYMQSASGIFNYLKGSVLAAIQREPTPDLNPDTLAALSALCLAQAQELIVFKATQDRMKSGSLAKVCAGTEELYAEALKLMQKESCKAIWEKEWLPLVAGKQGAFHGLTEMHQGAVCEQKKAIGEQISRLQFALDLLKQAQSRSGVTGFFAEDIARIERSLQSARKDNDFIYHERVPDPKLLEPIQKMSVAKPTPMKEQLSTNFTDLFAALVPVQVIQACVQFDLRKAEIVNQEVGKVKEATQLLNGVLVSLNLPAALEDSSGQAIPQSLREKAAAVREGGGVEYLRTKMAEMPELLQRNLEILNECERLLQEEGDSDIQLRSQFGTRWTRMESAKLTEPFQNNAKKYREIVNNAMRADETVKTKFQSHESGMELLSRSEAELESQMISGGGGGSVAGQGASTLRRLMDQVDALKAEREVLESELRNATVNMRPVFVNALSQEGSIQEQAISVEKLGEVYGPLQKEVKDSLERQEQLIAEIKSAHEAFVAERGGGSGGARESQLKDLAAAHDAFVELKQNLTEGAKFYNDLTHLLLTFQNKISDFCFARKTEKEELMKDLTSSLAKTNIGETPKQPAHLQANSPKPPPPARPPPPKIGTTPHPQPPTTTAPSAPSSALPYPVQFNATMPVPFSHAPYPYAPPPMPGGYNPYAPQPGGYSGFTPQQAYPQQPGGYPGGYPQQQPGYPPQAYPGYPGYYPPSSQ